jgi:uncharacterized membrane protein YdjX (TVP38/TMEM64 family)
MVSTSQFLMQNDREYQQALIDAGYTGPRGALLFCALLAVVGALLGSVVLAILGNMAVPGISETLSTVAGAAAGAGLMVLIGVVKIRQGNLEARELVEDREWRRQILRERGNHGP